MDDTVDLNGASDEIFISEDFVEAPVYQQARTGALDFDGLLSTPLRLHQDLTNGNGGQAWPAGMILSRYLCGVGAVFDTAMGMIEAKALYRIGAGSGLVGLTVALGCSPSRIILTDQAPMLSLMQQNIALNKLEGTVEASVYNWGEERPPSLSQSPDVILAGERGLRVLRASIPTLAASVTDLVGPRSICYFCFKKRRRADMHFIKAIKKEFIVEDVVDDPDHPNYTRENIFLYTIRQKGEA